MTARPPHMPGPRSSVGALFTSTLAALLAPRRAIPILLVCLPMVVAQRHFSNSQAAVWTAGIMCLLFVLLGPFTWRLLFPRGQRHTWLPLRLVAYSLLGALPALTGRILPDLFHIGATFLTGSISLLISATLFWVGGWGLARDIDQEEGLREQQQRAEQLARAAERSQLLALRAQLDPHFLFNTLNAIAEWCREDGQVAERAILSLAAMLRQVLAGVQQELWPLEQELQLIRELFDLHLLRDPTRFQLDWQVPEPLPACSVPPLLLLPLAENAVKHGPARGHGGALVVAVRSLPSARVEIRISNPGPFRGARAGGEGLAMVRRRLELTWPGQSSFSIGEEGDRTVATLTLPGEGPAA